MELNLSDLTSMNYYHIILLAVVVITMWLPFFRKLKSWQRLLILVALIIPVSLFTGKVGMLICFVSYFLLLLTIMFTNRLYVYTCGKCGFEKEYNQKLTLFKCPQCETENSMD